MGNSGRDEEVNTSSNEEEEYPMPSSVPSGMRLELSSSRVVSGREGEFEEWMDTLNNSYQECEQSLARQRAAFEATFKHVDEAGTSWIYHLSLVGEDGTGNDLTEDIDATHVEYAKRVKEPGWEELQPKFLLMPDPIKDRMIRWTETGQ